MSYKYDEFGNRFDSKGRIVFYQSEWPGKSLGEHRDDYGNVQIVVADPGKSAPARARTKKKKNGGSTKRAAGYCSKCKGPHVYKHGRA